MAAVTREAVPRRGMLLERLQARLAYLGAAALLLAAGWVAGEFAATGSPGSTEKGLPADRQLVAALIQRDLWQQMAPSGSAVIPLDAVGVPQTTVAFASVAEDAPGCRVRVIASGLPSPPRGMAYRAWLSTRDAAWRLVGDLRETSVGRWEFSARIDLPPDRLDSLEVRLVPAAAGVATGERVILRGRIWLESRGGR